MGIRPSQYTHHWPQGPPGLVGALQHTHIYFGHCYKKQTGWDSLLRRFHNGGGTLYDLEFLEDAQTRRRVVAFGFHAGFTGAAIGALAYASQQKDEVLGKLKPYDNEEKMIEDVKSALLGGSGQNMKVLVIGALGRCRRGAISLFKKIGVDEYVAGVTITIIMYEHADAHFRANIIEWDMAETAKGGPFQEILDVDIFVNCIYLQEKIPPFLTKTFIETAGEGRRLKVVVDVSCDTTNPFNPLPIYSVNTTFTKPTAPIDIR